MADVEFRATPIYVAPILVSLLVSVLCTLLIFQSGVELADLTVLPEAGYGPFVNALVFVFAAGFGATMIYFLLKHGVHRFLRVLIGATFSLLAFSLVIFYSELMFFVIGVEVPFVATLILAIVVAAFVVLEVFLKKGRFYEAIVLTLGGATGTLLGASIPMLSAVFILLLLAVYDVVAVFRGPIGKIAARGGLEHLPRVSFSFRNIQVGLGDLTFYSMLVSNVFLNMGWEAGAAAVLGVLVGSFLSFKMLEKKGMFPGLPFSVLLGLLASFVVAMLL